MRRARRLASAGGLSVGAALAIAPTAQAADFTVTTNLDAGPGSLRQAMVDADLTTAPDRILFAPSVTGTIALTTGDLYIENPLEIVGPGSDVLTVSGNNASRIFDIQQDFGENVTITGLHLNDGNASPDDGGAIFIDSPGRVVLSDLKITSSEADSGGGIDSRGSLRIEGSTISGNEAGSGGGVVANGGLLRVNSTTISGNQADDVGGGLASIYGVLKVENSTITGNSVDPMGSPSIGGGLLAYLGSATEFESTTISGNSAGAGGGGVASFFNLDDPVFHNSIVAGNTAPTQPDFTGLSSPLPVVVSASYSLIGNSSGVAINETVPGSNILDQAAGLAPLAANGGLTQTMAITETSPAFDAGDPDVFPDADQRGILRPQFTAPDMGAFELEDTVPPDATINKKPKKKLKTSKAKAKVTIKFKSNEVGSTFECSLKGGKSSQLAFAPCTSPTTYKLKSKSGKGKKYTFKVRATDATGNVGAPTTAKFKVIRK